MISTVKRRKGSDRLNKLLAWEVDGVCVRPGRLGEVAEQTTKGKEPHCGQDGRWRTTARRTGHQESELLDSTEEGGELTPGGPAGGKREAGSRS
jgi:hypothetical protein